MLSQLRESEETRTYQLVEKSIKRARVVPIVRRHWRSMENVSQILGNRRRTSHSGYSRALYAKFAYFEIRGISRTYKEQKKLLARERQHLHYTDILSSGFTRRIDR